MSSSIPDTGAVLTRVFEWIYPGPRLPDSSVCGEKPSRFSWKRSGPYYAFVPLAVWAIVTAVYGLAADSSASMQWIEWGFAFAFAFALTCLIFAVCVVELVYRASAGIHHDVLERAAVEARIDLLAIKDVERCEPDDIRLALDTYQRFHRGCLRYYRALYLRPAALVSAVIAVLSILASSVNGYVAIPQHWQDLVKVVLLPSLILISGVAGLASWTLKNDGGRSDRVVHILQVALERSRRRKQSPEQ